MATLIPCLHWPAFAANIISTAVAASLLAACSVDTEPLGARGECTSGYAVGIHGDGELICADAIDRLRGGAVQGDLELSGRLGIGTAVDDTMARVNVAGAVAIGRGTGGLAGGTSNNVLVHGRSDGAATASGVQLGDNASGTSRQFAIVNGHDGSTQTPGKLFVLASDAANIDPLSPGRATRVATMTADGRIGVGTSSPQATLDVRGDTRLGPQLLSVNEGAPPDQRVWAQYVDSTSWYLASTPDSLAGTDIALRVFRSGASITSIVLAASRVGINTGSPQSALQVSGYIQLDVTSGQPPTADCVAAGDYGRMKVDTVSGRLWICAGTWKYAMLQSPP